MAPHMPCYEVSGFGHFRYDPEIQPVQVQDWPPLWAVALMDETLGATYVRVLPTAEAARQEARGLCTHLLTDQSSRRQTIDSSMTGALREFGTAIGFERVAYGPVTPAGLKTLAPQLCDEDPASIERAQCDVAAKLLLATEARLRALPLSARHRIYAYAYTPRALWEPAPAVDALQVRVHVLCGCPNGNWISTLFINGEWVMDVPSCATINDAKSMIHGELWELNAARPADDGALTEIEMRVLDIRWTGSLAVTPTPDQSIYMLGTQLVCPLLRARDVEGGMPTLYIWA